MFSLGGPIAAAPKDQGRIKVVLRYAAGLEQEISISIPYFAPWPFPILAPHANPCGHHQKGDGHEPEKRPRQPR